MKAKSKIRACLEAFVEKATQQNEIGIYVCCGCGAWEQVVDVNGNYLQHIDHNTDCIWVRAKKALESGDE